MRQDEDGYFYIVTRAKDMIIRGGHDIYPREVEEAALRSPRGGRRWHPHEHYGEEVAAFFVRTEGSTLDADGVRTFAKERVAAYKYPRAITFIGALPKGATGKRLKRELRS